MLAHTLQNVAVRVFGGERSQGHLAIVTECDHASMLASTLQASARANAAPVTVFLHRRPESIGVRFFTPAHELELCGHGALAAAACLLRDDRTSVALDAPAQRVTVRRTGDLFALHGGQGTSSEMVEHERLLAALDLPASELTAPVSVASIGSRKAIVELRSLDRLEALVPDRSQLLDWSARASINGCYVVVRAGEDVYRTRSFNPSSGADEDAATGVAAGALVAARPQLHVDRWIEVQQGPRSSELCTLFARRRPDLAIEVAGRARVG